MIRFPEYIDLPPSDIATRLIEEHRLLRETTESAKIDKMYSEYAWIARDVRELKCIVSDLERRMHLPMDYMREPIHLSEPSVEVINYTPYWLNRLITRIKNDPALEIFKIIKG